MTEDEEYARSELYGLLAMLFYGPPSQVVLDLISDAAIEGEGVLADAWRVLQRASGKTDQDRAKDEYDDDLVSPVHVCYFILPGRGMWSFAC